MNITVILCTYNRPESLARALQSVAASILPCTVEWEVLVVDNNSNDQTSEVGAEFCRRYPGRFRYVVEPRQGKSHALNTGLRQAKGDILAFMDDDVIVEPTWLGNLTANLHGDEWAGSGGRILPEPGFSPPHWLEIHGRYELGGVLALFDRGDKSGELDWAPYGTNMAFRKLMFEKYGGFRTDLGPNRTNEIRGEDTEFGRRLVAGGERLRYEPLAVVYHPVIEKRLQKEYFLRWYFDFGRALVRELVRTPKMQRRAYLYFSIIRIGTLTMSMKGLRWVLALKPKRRFFYKAQTWRTAGEVVELYRLTRGDV
jgi:glycosyltransferase involved in cell wall biosynthesis